MGDAVTSRSPEASAGFLARRGCAALFHLLWQEILFGVARPTGAYPLPDAPGATEMPHRSASREEHGGGTFRCPPVTKLRVSARARQVSGSGRLVVPGGIRREYPTWPRPGSLTSVRMAADSRTSAGHVGDNRLLEEQDNLKVP